ncbi:unnamed protein product [Rotaria socialis]|uniref:ATP-dependent DNA helicase n=2 Tax=Rotaria socialis TaxID=392032 RepID=A0A818FLC8_9BILA|nr:unnamed protein product [Rotaria socialis]
MIVIFTEEQMLLYCLDKNESENKWICILCSTKIKRKQIPSRAVINNLQVCEIPAELKKLNDLEKHLIALRLPFMKIVNLVSGKISHKFAQKGTKGPLHIVPSDVEDTVMSLPRPIDKSMMIRLQLKRRLKYKAVWEEQLINPNDIRQALTVLKEKHPGYKYVQIEDIKENYLISDKNESNQENEINNSNAIDIEEITCEKSSTSTEITNDDHINRLALGDVQDCKNDSEEMDEDNDDIRAKYNIGTDSCIQPADFSDLVMQESKLHTVAPAEKNKLTALLSDNTIEALAFPHLFPDGRGSFDEKRQCKLGWKEYCKLRLFSSDSRFASDSNYIFFLKYLADLKQTFSSINIAFRKKLTLNVGQSSDDGQMKFLLGKDMIYRHFQSVRGSPQYWQQRLKDLFAMTRQLGCPTYFVTFSCADLRWKEFIDSFVRHTGEKVKDSYSFAEKARLLRTNPVIASRMFEGRFNNLMKLFIKGGSYSLGQVSDWFCRIEMQFRGSPHSHMPLWVEHAPKYNGVNTNTKTRDEIARFCDKYITTRFPSATEDNELHNIIKDVQTHSRSHSKSCLKYHNTICRFSFPRPVARRTFICEPFQSDNDECKERVQQAKKNLKEMNATMNMLEKDKTLLWSDFDSLLCKYNWTYDDYEWSLTVVHRRPTLIHKREPNARWVNQYDEELLRAWNANIDIQFVLDPYACAKYLMSYTTKPEREMSLLLEATHKECREGNISVREEMKKLTGTFFNHRQVSVQEAIYRATGMPLTYSSRKVLFIPSHSNSCRFLKPQHILKQMDDENSDIYMSNLADKYFDRPLDSDLNICIADFASDYDIVSANISTKKTKSTVKKLQTLPFAIKKRCNKKAITRYPFFNRETDQENYFENLLVLYLPIRNRDEFKKPYQLYYENGIVYDYHQNCNRKVKDIVSENRKKYECHFDVSKEMESIFNELATQSKEDDWADVVANIEKNRLGQNEIENEENPDFELIHKKKKNNNIFDLKQSCHASNEIRPLLESMSEEQKKHLEPDENIEEIHTLITAFKGAAAVNVGGITIHSAFGMSTQRSRFYENLSCEKLNTYRCKLGSLKLLFVDEVSLVQEGLWGAMHSRLNQIMGIHSNSVIFGNVGVIAIGDFYQCAPVASSSIYSSLLWTDHFEFVELTANQRQKNDGCFAQMLNRIRQMKKKSVMVKEDQHSLEKCHERYVNNEYHPEALHLFSKNADVDAHNEKMIDLICTNIKTIYELDRKGQKIEPKTKRYGKQLYKPLRLAKNARIMLTKNISVHDGLANGVTGRIFDFVENNDRQISRILIKCDSVKAGVDHRRSCSTCKKLGTICVTRENDCIDTEESVSKSTESNKQFPLRLSWAVTIHKAQGITVDEIVISSKNLFGSGMGYTALSRVRTINGLFLIDLHFDKFYCDEKVEKVLLQMKPMEKKCSVFHDRSTFLNVTFHNIEGLQSNFKALKNHHLLSKADIICLAETWLDNTNMINEYDIENYRFIHRDRTSSFKVDHPLHLQKRGGVGIYIRNDIAIKTNFSKSQLNLEYVAVELQDDLIIIVCYRSPTQKKKQFLTSLFVILNSLDMHKKILIIGDFNEDSSRNDCKTIEIKMTAMKFQNIFQNIPSTNNLTCLDCVYSNFLFDIEHHESITETFYSFHEALSFCFKTKHNGWIFSNNPGILSSPLGIALSNSYKNQTGLRLWGSLEQVDGSSIFRMQSWNQFQSANPSFSIDLRNNEVVLLRDALISTETSTIEISIIDIRPTYEYEVQNTTKTTTFVLIGDANCTSYLMINDLKPDTICTEKTYVLTKVRSKKFNGSIILSTTIDTNISISMNEILPDISNIGTTLELDLNDNKTITTRIDEITDIHRMTACVTCKGDLVDVMGTTTLVYCGKCHRHSLKKNLSRNISTTIVIQIEKHTLRASDLVLNELLTLVGASVDDTDTDIAAAVLSYGNIFIQYSELRKQILLVMKP